MIYQRFPQTSDSQFWNGGVTCRGSTEVSSIIKNWLYTFWIQGTIWKPIERQSPALFHDNTTGPGNNSPCIIPQTKSIYVKNCKLRTKPTRTVTITSSIFWADVTLVWHAQCDMHWKHFGLNSGSANCPNVMTCVTSHLWRQLELFYAQNKECFSCKTNYNGFTIMNNNTITGYLKL